MPARTAELWEVSFMLLLQTISTTNAVSLPIL